MTWKPRPCKKLTGIISADLVPIDCVCSSHQFSRTFHEVVTHTAPALFSVSFVATPSVVT